MMATGTQEIPQSVQADPDDVLLVKRFQRGEESAFNHLVIRYQTTIYQLAQRYTTKHEDTLDITQGSLKPIEDCPVSTDSASLYMDLPYYQQSLYRSYTPANQGPKQEN